MKKRLASKRPKLRVPFIADDATGLPSIPPGVETDRYLVEHSDWEGEKRPSPKGYDIDREWMNLILMEVIPIPSTQH